MRVIAFAPRKAPQNKNYWEEDLRAAWTRHKNTMNFIAPHVRESKEVLEFWTTRRGFRFYVSATWIPVSNCSWDSRDSLSCISDSKDQDSWSQKQIFFYRIPDFPVIHRENSRLTKQGRLCSQAQYKPGFLTPYVLKETARLTILKRLCSIAQRFFFTRVAREVGFLKRYLFVPALRGRDYH